MANTMHPANPANPANRRFALLRSAPFMAKIVIFFVVLWVLFGIPLLGAMMRTSTAATAAVNGMHTAATFADGDEARPHQLDGHLRRSTSPEALLDRDEARRDREEARRELEHARRDREEGCGDREVNARL